MNILVCPHEKVRFDICIAVGDEEKETEVQIEIESAFIAESGSSDDERASETHRVNSPRLLAFPDFWIASEEFIELFETCCCGEDANVLSIANRG